MAIDWTTVLTHALDQMPPTIGALGAFVAGLHMPQPTYVKPKE